MKKLMCAIVLLPLALFARTTHYDLTMSLKVPAIVDNSRSLGKRVYKVQRIKGRVVVAHDKNGGEPSVEFRDMVNKSHKMSNGQYVKYATVVESGGWHAVGNNRTGVFKKPSVFLTIEATPSYALADGEDNTLIVTLAGGNGSSDRKISGYVAGQLGCGCYAYGHVSPTRILGTCTVVDTAAVWGSFTMKKVMECD